MDQRSEWKLAAALAASQLVSDDMVIGLGTGSTASLLVSVLGDRVRRGLSILAIPTSETTRAQAEAEGIPLIGFGDRAHIDLTIDGADEIARGSLDLIKGGGGALLREKIVASASSVMVVIADSSKVVDKLGGKFPLPIEIVPFGWEATIEKISDHFDDAGLRHNLQGLPFVTDGGHYIVDCAMGEVADVAALERELRSIVGVVEVGLFVGIAQEAFIGGPDGVKRLRRE